MKRIIRNSKNFLDVARNNENYEEIGKSIKKITRKSQEVQKERPGVIFLKMVCPGEA